MNKTDVIHASPRLIESFKGKSFLSTENVGRPELSELLDLAVQHKHGGIDPGTPLTGKAVGMVFFNPSLRTRTSMTIAIQQLGGVPVPLHVGTDTWTLEFEEGAVMDGDGAEHIKEAAPVLSSYLDAIGVRCFSKLEDYQRDKKEEVLGAFEKYSSVPVINLESSTQHPLQGLGDVMTINERFGTVDQRKVVLAWTYHPRPLPVAVSNSFALAAAQYGMNLTIACPPEYGLDEETMAMVEAKAEANEGSVKVTDNLEEACGGAEVVYAKSWASLPYYGRLEGEAKLRAEYRGWIIDEELMEATASDGVFMHCLPVRRNVVATDGVLDGPRSIVIQQAHNRLHLQKTLLSLMLS